MKTELSSSSSMPVVPPRPVSPARDPKILKRPQPLAAKVLPASQPRSPAVEVSSVENEPKAESTTERRPLFNSMRNAPAWLISMLLHLAIILAMALMTLTIPEARKELSILVAPSEEFEPLEEHLDESEVDVELDAEDFSESLQASELTSVELDVQAISDAVGIENAPPIESAINTSIQVNGPGIESLMETIPGGGSNLGDMGKLTKFFGTEAAGQRIAFVVDNSNSMVKGRLETALVELADAIDQLSSGQDFYVVFYSDTAYPLFHPSPASGMVKATSENKRRVREWLDTIQMCHRTDGSDAMELAFQQRPDVMYILGDGAFSDDAGTLLLDKNSTPRVTIHTIGMEVKPRDAKVFGAIATTHGGTYRDVGVTDAGSALYQQAGPRKRNKVRGPVWGLKLLPAKK